MNPVEQFQQMIQESTEHSSSQILREAAQLNAGLVEELRLLRQEIDDLKKWKIANIDRYDTITALMDIGGIGRKKAEEVYKAGFRKVDA